MLIFNKSTLVKFWTVHPDSKNYLEAWYKEAYKARWNNPHDVKATYSHASILKNSRIVFNVSGNKYRLIVQSDFVRHWLLIRFIGTHAEYDKIDAETYDGIKTVKK